MRKKKSEETNDSESELWCYKPVSLTNEACGKPLAGETAMMGELQCDPADFKGRIIFMYMFNDLVWDAKGNGE